MEILFLLILFAAGHLLKSNAEKKRREQAERGVDLEETPAEPDDLMEEIRRAMEGMRQQRQPGTLERPQYGQGRAQLPPPDFGDDSFEEENESLEEVPTIRSLEDEVVRPERVQVDYDLQSEAAVQRRIEWAEVRARAHQPEDHRAFDRRIRAVEPEVVPAVAAGPSIDRKKLMQLVVWREILDKPLALRERDRA